MPVKVDKLAVKHMEAELLNLHLDWMNAGEKTTLQIIMRRAAEHPSKFLEIIRRVAFSSSLESVIKTSALIRADTRKARNARKRIFGDERSWSNKKPTEGQVTP